MTRPTTKQKLEALKRGVELPVDPAQLYKAGSDRPVGVDEKAVLTLATEYQKAENSTRAAVSYENQKKAAEYFNEHGLIKTLDEIVRVGGEEALDVS